MATSLIRPCNFLLLFVHILHASLAVSSAQRNDESAFDRKETRGNMTFGCNSPGPCIPCSYVEKNDEETYHCSVSGYRQSYKCTELSSSAVKGHISGSRKLASVREVNGILHEKKANDVDQRFFGYQKLDVTIHDEHKFVRLYFTCLPTDTDEKLTVWAFEAIMVGLLGVSAPVIYHRRKRNFATSGMARLPTSARF